MWRSWPWLWISIHAPAKGATICARQQDVNKNHFNPRSREGSDRCRSWWFERKEQFQSTLPRRERPKAEITDPEVMQFQSTLPRRERRRKPKQGTNHVNISIHAPAKGATHRIRDLQRKDRFQSTLPRRERHRLHLIKRSDMNFNPRSREGSDGKYLYGIRRQHHFNPRSREGSDDLRQMGQGRPCRETVSSFV